jgi:hypothetical protein
VWVIQRTTDGLFYNGVLLADTDRKGKDASLFLYDAFSQATRFNYLQKDRTPLHLGEQWQQVPFDPKRDGGCFHKVRYVEYVPRPSIPAALRLPGSTGLMLRGQL